MSVTKSQTHPCPLAALTEIRVKQEKKKKVKIMQKEPHMVATGAWRRGPSSCSHHVRCAGATARCLPAGAMATALRRQINKSSIQHLCCTPGSRSGEGSCEILANHTARRTQRADTNDDKIT